MNSRRAAFRVCRFPFVRPVAPRSEKDFGSWIVSTVAARFCRDRGFNALRACIEIMPNQKRRVSRPNYAFTITTPVHDAVYRVAKRARTTVENGIFDSEATDMRARCQKSPLMDPNCSIPLTSSTVLATFGKSLCQRLLLFTADKRHERHK